MWYCLPDSLSLLVYNPETASRVTLALLGTVFQTKLPTTDNQTPTTKHQQPIIIYFYLLIFYFSTKQPDKKTHFAEKRKKRSLSR